MMKCPKCGCLAMKTVGVTRSLMGHYLHYYCVGCESLFQKEFEVKKL